MANPDTPGAAKPAEPAINLTKPESAWRAWLGRGWGWMVLACVILASGGVARAIQQQQIVRDKSVFEPCPFPLAEMPFQFGDWVSNPGDVQVLDDKTIRITGSTDRIVRVYTNKITGVQVTSLVLYGPAEPVVPHTPEVCFPATGFNQEGAGGYADIVIGKERIPFRTATYVKSGGGQASKVRSYFTFRMPDEWSPDVGSGKRFYRSNPGIFKIQIQRPMTFNEQASTKRDDAGKSREPIEDFLTQMLDVLEQRIAAAKNPRSSKAGVAQRDARNSGSDHARAAVADRPRLAMGSGMN